MSDHSKLGRSMLACFFDYVTYLSYSTKRSSYVIAFVHHSQTDATEVTHSRLVKSMLGQLLDTLSRLGYYKYTEETGQMNRNKQSQCKSKA